MQVTAIPIRPDAHVWGVLTCHQPVGSRPALDEDTAQFLGDAVGTAPFSDTERLTTDVEGPWSARSEVHQAAGMVIAQLHIRVGDAMALLRAHAFAQNRTLAEVAASVLNRTLDFSASDLDNDPRRARGQSARQKPDSPPEGDPVSETESQLTASRVRTKAASHDPHSLQALTRATSALVSDHDVTDVLATLLTDACAALNAAAAGMLVITPEHGLEVLAATSHQAQDFELYQIQQLGGPCVEAIQTEVAVAATGHAALTHRWPNLSEMMAAAGYDGVHAHPMLWQDHAVGAINFFHRRESPYTEGDLLAGRAFADVATLVMLSPFDVTAEQVAERIQAALESRIVIEQAKGVLMYQRNLDPAAAFDLLRDLAAHEGTTLMRTAHDIIANTTP